MGSCGKFGWALCAAACITTISSAGAVAGTWVGYNTGLRNLTINGITVAPSDPNTIYLQTRSLGVYKSIDAGANWSKTATFNNDNGPGYDHLVHEGPAVHPTNPDVVWVASGGQVYKTTNGGGSWSLSSTGTTINGCNGVHGIVVDSTNPDHLLAGTIIAGCDGGVLESTDGGATWTNIAGSNVGGSGVGNDAWPIAIDASNTNRVYCGSPHNSVYRSTDGGNTWINSPPLWGDHSSYAVVINPAVPGEVWCSEAGGTWVSSDYGVSWVRQTALFNDNSITTMRFAPSNPQVAYAIVGDTIWRSDDNGDNWTAGAVMLGGPRAIEIDPTNPDMVYVGTSGLGMSRSSDGGQTFAEANVGLPMTSLIHGYQAFGDPLEPGAMYCILTGNTIFRLGAGETDWQYYSVLPGSSLPNVFFDPCVPARWYWASGGLWRSLDSGLTWEEVYRNGSNTSVFGVWLDPRRCGRILIGDRDSRNVLESSDGGDTWTTLGQPIPSFSGSLTDVSGDSYDLGVILASASPAYHSDGQNGYVWRSTDQGQTWEHIRDGMFYGDWRIGNGYWKLENYRMRQLQSCCGGYHVNLDHHTFEDGTFECRVKIDSASDTNYWAGFLIRATTPDDHFVDSGWLVYMRKNGVVALHNNVDGTVINVDQVPVIADTSQFNTLRLVANDNHFELYANDSLVGTYTDVNHRYDAAGYFALQTNKTIATFDDLVIQAETTYADSFDLSAQFGAYWGRFLAADPHNPGRFAYATQWGGLWYTRDHGTTWEKISPDSRNGYVYYRPIFSRHFDGNLYADSGYSYSWRVDNYYNDGNDRQQVGQNLSYSTWLLGEDPTDPNRLYGAFYDLGISYYDGQDILGDPAGDIPVSIDADYDGDIDQEDFGVMQRCLSGEGIPQPNLACRDMRIDTDDDVDQTDLAEFVSCMAAPGIEPDPACK